MAKKGKIKTVGTTAPTPVQEDKEWQRRDDADAIKRYAKLRGDSSRHKAALDHIRSEHEAAIKLADDFDSREDVSAPRMLARSGRKRSARNIGRRAGAR